MKQEGALLVKERQAKSDQQQVENDLVITEIEKSREITPDPELGQLKRNLETREIPLEEIRRIGSKLLKKAFEKDQYSNNEKKQGVWRKVINYLREINSQRYNHFSYWSLLSPADDSVVGSIDKMAKRKKVLSGLKERGFNSIDEIKIENISVEEITKREAQAEELGDFKYLPIEQSKIMEIKGKITLDSFLLTDGQAEFSWKGSVFLDTDYYAQLVKGSPQSEVYLHIDFDRKGLDKYIEANITTAARESISLSLRQDKRIKKHGLNYTYYDNKQRRSLDISHEINRKLGEKLNKVLQYYVKNYVHPEQFESWESLKTKFHIQSEISDKTEKEIDQMFIKGLQTGEFDSMLLYIGEGAQKFLDITASEDYKLSNKEFLLMQENMGYLSQLLENTHIYELGPGNGKKTKELLQEIAGLRQKRGESGDINYHPVDINPIMIYATSQELADLEAVEVEGHVCDFHHVAKKVDDHENSFLLLGCTLGNGDRSYQASLLKDVRKAMKPGEKLVVGVQMKSDLKKVVESYQGHDSVIFIKQVLTRFGIKEEETHFQALPDEKNNRIIMRLIFKKDQEIKYKDTVREFKAGDSLQIIVSHKYEVTEVDEIFQPAGFRVIKQIENENKDYQLITAEAV